MKDKIIKLLNRIFAPRITYYSSDNMTQAEMNKKFKKMSETMIKISNLMNEL
jgi:hypothetical protein